MCDQLAAIKQCETEVGTDEAVLKACVEGADSNIVQPRIIEGVEDIIGVLDSTEPGGGHYTGPIIVVGYYNPYSFVLRGSDQLVGGPNSLNSTLASEVESKFPNVTYREPVPDVQQRCGEKRSGADRHLQKYRNVQSEHAGCRRQPSGEGRRPEPVRSRRQSARKDRQRSVFEKPGTLSHRATRVGKHAKRPVDWPGASRSMGGNPVVVSRGARSRARWGGASGRWACVSKPSWPRIDDRPTASSSSPRALPVQLHVQSARSAACLVALAEG